MESNRSLDSLLTNRNDTNAQNFTVFVLSNHFANLCSNQLSKIEEAAYITNDISANRFFSKFFRAFTDATKESVSFADFYDFYTNFDEKASAIGVALEKSVQFAISTTYNFFTQKSPDTIIIYEDKLSFKKIIKIITKCSKELKVHPKLILILKDNNIERAKNYLDLCPNDTTIKFITNFDDTKNKIIPVFNNGAKNSKDFFEFFGEHCFGTCSNTANDILINDENNSYDKIKDYIPMLLKCKSSLLTDNKDLIKNDLNDTILKLSNISKNDENIVEYRNLECLFRSFRMLCYDSGKNDISKTIEIAKISENKLVRANALKFSHFMPVTRVEKQELLDIASNIFNSYGIIDQEIYCKNNKYIHDFSLKDKSESSTNFNELVSYAENAALGMVGLPNVINNLGVAYTFEGNYQKAVESFNEGLDNINNNHRVQYFALKSNLMIAELLSGKTITNEDVISFIDDIFKKMPQLKIDYLMCHYVLNVLAVCVTFNNKLYKELINKYPIYSLMNVGLMNNMGTGSMTFQMRVLASKYSGFDMLQHINLPDKLTEFIGERKIFTEQTGFNPFLFNLWL